MQTQPVGRVVVRVLERDESRLNQRKGLDDGRRESHLSYAQPSEQRAVEAQLCDVRGVVMVANCADDGLIGCRTWMV